LALRPAHRRDCLVRRDCCHAPTAPKAQASCRHLLCAQPTHHRAPHRAARMRTLDHPPSSARST
jgi:hypothetical protein